MAAPRNLPPPRVTPGGVLSHDARLTHVTAAPPPAFALGQSVLAAVIDGGRLVERRAVVVARTFEAHPRYDLRFAGGGLVVNLGGHRLRPMGPPVLVRGTQNAAPR